LFKAAIRSLVSTYGVEILQEFFLHNIRYLFHYSLAYQPAVFEAIKNTE